MMDSTEDEHLFLWPVRRTLTAVTLAYLTGILFAMIMVFPKGIFALLSTLSLALVWIRLRRRKSVLFFILLFAFFLGNVYAGYELHHRDLPTKPGVQLDGIISRIEKPYRVYLKDVHIDGKPSAYARDVVVTLMREEDGEEALHPHVGQRVSGTGRLFAPDEKRNPGGVDWRIQSICKGYELSGYILPGWSGQGEAVFSLRECMRGLRSMINERIELLFGTQAPLFQGIMLGDKSALDDEITAAMRLTGTAHILTVSGMHLSMIAGMISAVLSRFPIGRKGKVVILGVIIILFTGITGMAAGSIRACIMVMLREAAKLRGRRYEPLTALSVAALCITLVQPLYLFHASFQFSFFVVLCIQLFAGVFGSFTARRLKLNGRAMRLNNLLAVSLSAQLGSIPMQLMLYGYVPLLSLPMNLLCAMLMPLLLLGGWTASALSLISMDAGRALAFVLARAASGFESGSLFVASLRGAICRLPAPNGITMLLVFVLALLLSSRIRLGARRKTASLMVLVAVLVGYALRLDPQPRYVQLDVGQGDAALFRRGNRTVLVDVGPADSYEMLRYLRHEGLHVEAVILSHLDVDHAGALGVLLASEVDIPQVIMAEGADQQEVTPEVCAALNLLDSSHIPVHKVSRGDRIDGNGISFDVLAPDDAVWGSNECSLLLYADMEELSFLLAGDLPISSEPERVPQADILKVAHHGSRNSTSDEFARMAKPELAIISVGADNRYGHPHARVLDALEDAQVLRTDLCGCITVRLFDGTWKVECFTGVFEKGCGSVFDIFTKMKHERRNF